MSRIKIQITTPSNNVIKVSPGVSALSSVQLYLNELIDVNSEHGAEGYVLTQQADGTFAMEAVATTLSDLSDTNIANPQGGDSLVYDDSSQKWVPGGVKSVNGEDGDVVISIPSPRPTPGIDGLTDTNITNLQDNQIIRYDFNSGKWLNEDLEALPSGGTTGQALVKATGTDYDVEWADIAIDTQYHDRFATDAETFRSGATDTVELYYTAKADGDGFAESASRDAPTAGNVINRKIYYSEAAFADPDTGTWVEFTPAPADDASFATVKAALLEYLKARTGGTVPISLKQTWEEANEPTLLLDTYTGATGAYSLRKLRTAYTGDCIEVWNGSSYADIGFVDDELDTTALANHCGSNDGFVSKLYDQSGNTNTAAQTNTNNMPKIYDGITGYLNGMKFTPSSNTNLRVSVTFDMSDVSAALVAQADATGSYAIIDAHETSQYIYFTFGINNGNVRTVYRKNGNVVRSESISAFDDLFLATMFADNTPTNDSYLDGNQMTGTNSPPSTANTTNNIRIGQRGSGSADFSGLIREFVVYFSDESDYRAGIESNIATYYNITI